MAIPAVGAGGAAAPQAAPDGGGAKFDNAIDNASGEEGQLEEQMVTQGVTIMGQIMMQRANEILGEAMEDDEG